MRRDDAAYLLDMLNSAREAVALVEGVSYGEFLHDRRSHLAMLKLIEIVGEAASRVSAETRNAHVEIQWVRIVGMRNHLVHAYFEVDLRIVWDTVQVGMPDLISRLEPLVLTET